MPRRLPPNVERHGDGYRAAFMRDGQRIKSRTVPTIAEASRLAESFRAAKTPRFYATLADGFDLVRENLRGKDATPGSLRYYEGQFRTLETLGKTTPLEDISAETVRAFVTMRLRSVSASTVVKNARALGRIFKLAMRDDLAAANPVERVDLPTPRPKRFPYFTTDELAKVVAKIRRHGGDADADLIELAFFAGLRRSELARLRPEDVDLANGRIAVRGKTADETIRIAKNVRGAVGRIMLRGPRPDGTLFGTADSISYRFGIWRKRLREKRLAPHAMRHSFATALVRAGVPVEEAQIACRHKTLSMTLRYYHGNEDAAQETVDRLSLTHGEPPPSGRSANR